jgi:hypothetical protein
MQEKSPGGIASFDCMWYNHFIIRKTISHNETLRRIAVVPMADRDDVCMGDIRGGGWR